MAMYLSGVPVYTIMLLGRWSSDAFLHYIRKQVKEFSLGISKKMITKEDFFTIPIANLDNPCTWGHTLNLPCRNNGLSFKSAA